MAIMGLDEPEPWIFVAMQKDTGEPDGICICARPGADARRHRKFAQMLDFRTGRAKVAPAPATNNLNDDHLPARRASESAAPQGRPQRRVDRGLPQWQSSARSDVKKIVDIIADPVKSHFFNTDCVSCHTDTMQAIERRVAGLQG